MNFKVYILYSESIDRYYVGQTENMTERLLLHNTGTFKDSSTKGGIPWGVFLEIMCISRTQALAIESHIKKMESVKYYHSLRQYPEIIIKLKERYHG